MDWAKHRRRKAAAKTHMRLNLQNLLPNFVIIDTAGEHDNQRARELCAGVYQDVFGSAPRIKSIHAGLECGLLGVKLPKTDMISFGPNLYNVHTPEEHLSIKSVANTWKFLTAVLAKLQ